MKQRIISSVILTIIILGIAAASFYFPWVLSVCFLCLNVAAVCECLKAIGTLRRVLLCAICLAAVASANVLVFLKMYDSLWICVTLFAVLLMTAAVIYREKNVACGLGGICISGIYTAYVTIGMCAYSYLMQSSATPLAGLTLVLTVLLGTWCCDVGGWLFGITMGKHKLCPNISPKKSVEGLIGSVVLAELSLVGFALLSRVIIPDSPLNLTAFAVISPFMAVAELIGDLSASVLKRENGIKDFGTVIVGHGGIMDRFDGVVMSGALFAVISAFVPLFVGR